MIAPVLMRERVTSKNILLPLLPSNCKLIEFCRGLVPPMPCPDPVFEKKVVTTAGTFPGLVTNIGAS